MSTPNVELAVVTPSYLPDLELCTDLNRSVMEMTERDVVHHIIVPSKDLNAFGYLASARTRIHDIREYLPRTFLQPPRLNLWVNRAHPWPPIRGWIAQQIIKLAAVEQLEVQGVLLLDSDSVLIRPTTLDAFRVGGHIAMYRKPSGVDSTLPGHRLWHASARKLLGAAATPEGDLTDYICWPCLWEPRVVRSLLRHVERATGTAWATAVGSQLHFSEMMLYGVYVDEVLGGADASVTEMQGIVYSEEFPLTRTEIDHLLASAPPDKIAVMLSAKSGIALETRRNAIRDFTAALPAPLWRDDK